MDVVVFLTNIQWFPYFLRNWDDHLCWACKIVPVHCHLFIVMYHYIHWGAMINQYLGVALSTYLADGINIYIYLLLRLLWLVVSFQGITSSSPSWMISWRNTTPDTSGWWKSGFFNDRSWALRWNKPSLVGGRPQMSRKNILPKKQTKSHWNMMLGRRTFLLNMVPLQDAMLVTGKTYTIISWNFHHTNPSVSSYQNPYQQHFLQNPVARSLTCMHVWKILEAVSSRSLHERSRNIGQLFVNLTETREFFPLVFGDQSLVQVKLCPDRIQKLP